MTGLEALNCLINKIPLVLVETNSTKYIEDIEKELKALEIIKRILKDKKGGDYLHYLVNYIREYPEDKLCYFVGFMGDEYPILVNDEEYELLKEVLK